MPHIMAPDDWADVVDPVWAGPHIICAADGAAQLRATVSAARLIVLRMFVPPDLVGR
jgi:hypothetical protein